MIFKDFDLYSMPSWMSGIFDDLEEGCINKLEKESNFYKQILKESSDLLERYRYISILSAGDDLEEPIELSIEGARALARFMRLESDRKDMEVLQTYLFGLRHMFQLLHEQEVL